MELVVNAIGQSSSGQVTVSDSAFAIPFKQGLVHQVVTAYLAGGRAGTKAQKNRHDVRGGGRKPWRQKGTGSARAGSINSPLWRGGGKTFAATPRDFSQKVNKKMYQHAMASILSELVRQQRVMIVSELKLAQAKTKALKTILDQLSLEKVLILLDGDDTNIRLAARNLINVEVCDASRVDPVSLVAADKILVTVDAIKKIETRLL